MKRLYRLTRALAPDWTGRVEYALGRRMRSLPMNGQAARLEMVRDLVHACDITEVVETGTFRGATTEYLASFGLPTTTFELDATHAAFSRRRLRDFPHVALERGHSVEGLRAFFARRGALEAPVLFYLDAHWYDDLPLAEELRLIFAAARRAVVLVDDFQVPDDPTYAFDDYGPGKTLDLDYLEAVAVRDLQVFFPRVPGDKETGARRGAVVLARCDEMVARLHGIRLLRPWTPAALVA